MLSLGSLKLFEIENLSLEIECMDFFERWVKLGIEVEVVVCGVLSAKWAMLTIMSSIG